ncbi:uncharacterized protein LOC142239268 [Haematobia irritans]|uniref:uncharacterized protein LOC142239268 n=1 Tax=Haematobia irritans TaxID=7368 RepID=UPI003F4FDEE4
MASPKWSLFVAGLFIFISSCSVLYTLGGLFGLYDYDDDDTSDEKSEEKVGDTDNEQLKQFTREEIAEYTFELLSNIAILIAAVFMYVGLKKRLYKFIAPWLIISLSGVVGETVIMYFENDSKLETSIYFVLILFITVLWYPIYKQYKLIRYPKSIVSTNAPNTEMCYTATAYSHQTATAPVEV